MRKRALPNGCILAGLLEAGHDADIGLRHRLLRRWIAKWRWCRRPFVGDAVDVRRISRFDAEQLANLVMFVPAVDVKLDTNQAPAPKVETPADVAGLQPIG